MVTAYSEKNIYIMHHIVEMTLNAQFAFDSSSFKKFTELWYYEQVFNLLFLSFINCIQ